AVFYLTLMKVGQTSKGTIVAGALQHSIQTFSREKLFVTKDEEFIGKTSSRSIELNIDILLAEFDGKHTDGLKDVYQKQEPTDALMRKLIDYARTPDPQMQSGATWLIKKYVENGFLPNEKNVHRLLDSLEILDCWEAKLHLCQILPYFTIAGRKKKQVEKFLRSCLAEDNKFVRAWAYNGFYELAVQHREYMDEAVRMLNSAMNDEAASVRARIRNILAKR
ncbi:MAG: hypothetical protein ACE5IR_19830, partial [bacterium]